MKKINFTILRKSYLPFSMREITKHYSTTRQLFACSTVSG